MKPILVIAAQPTVDRTVVISDFERGVVHRVKKVAVLPSGKALNVARTLNRLGVKISVVALLAGRSGDWIREKLESEKISVQFVAMKGENRVAYSIYDDQTNLLTEIIEDTDGPITSEIWEKFFHKIAQNIETHAAVIISGRGPLAFPDNGYYEIIKQSHEKGVPVFLDAYGPLLDFALLAKPYLLKINTVEAGKLLSKQLSTREDRVMAVKQIQDRGIEIVVLTSGSGSVTCAYKHELWIGHSPELKGAAIGSGDVMMAGLVRKILAKESIGKSLQFGMAMGTANVAIPGAGLFYTKDVERIIQDVKISRVAQ